MVKSAVTVGKAVLMATTVMNGKKMKMILHANAVYFVPNNLLVLRLHAAEAFLVKVIGLMKMKRDQKQETDDDAALAVCA